MVTGDTTSDLQKKEEEGLRKLMAFVELEYKGTKQQPS